MARQLLEVDGLADGFDERRIKKIIRFIIASLCLVPRRS